MAERKEKRNSNEQSSEVVQRLTTAKLSSYPPHDRWDDWVEFDAKSWPKKVERRYSLVPTT